MSLKNSRLTIRPRPIACELAIPGSKSYANRMLILAALNPKPVAITNLPRSSDVLKMIEALEEIGLQFERRNDEIKVINSFPECEKVGEEPIVVHSGDGGTTTRFLSALVAKGRRPYHIEPSGGMRKRPLKEMIEALRELGASVSTGNSVWLSIQGPIHTNKVIEVDCSRSTQFASALALVLKEDGALIQVKEMRNSKAYFEMTQELVKQSDKTVYKVPLDFSSASYPLALAAVTGNVTLINCLHQDPYQADSVFLNVLKDAGAFTKFNTNGFELYKNAPLKPFNISCAACPDLAPTLAYLASFCEGQSVLCDLGVLAHKESHRLVEIKKLLDVFKVDYDSDDLSYLKINGKPAASYSAKRVILSSQDLPEDHRIIMTAYLFMRTLGGGELGQTHHVKKSFSNFFELMGEEC